MDTQGMIPSQTYWMSLIVARWEHPVYHRGDAEAGAGGAAEDRGTRWGEKLMEGGRKRQRGEQWRTGEVRRRAKSLISAHLTNTHTLRGSFSNRASSIYQYILDWQQGLAADSLCHMGSMYTDKKNNNNNRRLFRCKRIIYHTYKRGQMWNKDQSLGCSATQKSSECACSYSSVTLLHTDSTSSKASKAFSVWTHYFSSMTLQYTWYSPT